MSGEIRDLRVKHTAAQVTSLSSRSGSEGISTGLLRAQTQLIEEAGLLRGSIQDGIMRSGTLQSSDYRAMRSAVATFESQRIPEILIENGVLESDRQSNPEEIAKALQLVDGAGKGFVGKYQSAKYTSEVQGWAGATIHYLHALETKGSVGFRSGEYRVEYVSGMPVPPEGRVEKALRTEYLEHIAYLDDTHMEDLTKDFSSEMLLATKERDRLLLASDQSGDTVKGITLEEARTAYREATTAFLNRTGSLYQLQMRQSILDVKQAALRQTARV